MTINLDDMSRSELLDLQKGIEKALKSVEQRERKMALAEAEKAAAQYGFSLSELTGAGGKAGRAKSPAAVKYRNPEDPTQTWSGRGRRPEWIKALDAAGNMDSALV